jgi:hyperosmotically inducible protein
MKMSLVESYRYPLSCAVLALSMYAMATSAPLYQETQQPAADNPKTNKNQTIPTADQRMESSSDRAITQKIRKTIHDESTLSPDTHNIKIVTQDGKVTLRGPVRSEGDKNDLQDKATRVAEELSVSSKLEIAPSK